MYAVIAIFDHKTEQTIKNIWEELMDQSISFYAYEIEDRRPHITLASYNQLNQNDFIRDMDWFYDKQISVPINFNSIGSFLNSGTLYLSPTFTKGLFELHVNHHQHFKQYNDEPNSLYLPNNWIPHCTIANRLSSTKLAEAFAYCSKRCKIINGAIKEIALIKLLDKNKAPIIFSKALK